MKVGVVLWHTSFFVRNPDSWSVFWWQKKNNGQIQNPCLLRLKPHIKTCTSKKFQDLAPAPIHLWWKRFWLKVAQNGECEIWNSKNDFGQICVSNFVGFLSFFLLLFFFHKMPESCSSLHEPPRNKKRGRGSKDTLTDGQMHAAESYNSSSGHSLRWQSATKNPRREVLCFMSPCEFLMKYQLQSCCMLSCIQQVHLGRLYELFSGE